MLKTLDNALRLQNIQSNTRILHFDYEMFMESPSLITILQLHFSHAAFMQDGEPFVHGCKTGKKKAYFLILRKFSHESYLSHNFFHT